MATDPGDEEPKNPEVGPLPSSVGARSVPGEGAEALVKTKLLLSVKRDGKCPIDGSANGELQMGIPELNKEEGVSDQSTKSYPDTLCNGTSAKGKNPTPSDTGLINLILQFLNSSGFLRTAECLIRELNLNVEKYAATEFKRSVLSGMWSEAEGLLPLLKIAKKNLESLRLYSYFFTNKNIWSF